jgi:hypothetical protein
MCCEDFERSRERERERIIKIDGEQETISFTAQERKEIKMN